ncbi:sodium:calcium antiporter [bacterium]|nr:sodium:calcium antiporter [bacterium]
MTLHILLILAYLYVFYFVAILFTNGIEWLGVKFRLPAGALGSVFAAVGTALPETLVALIAIFSGAAAAHEIGIGAILGAPFMLSSIAFFVIGITYVICRKRGVRRNNFDIETTVIRTDISYFIIVFSIAAVSGLLPNLMRGITVAGFELAHILHVLLGICLIVLYFVYVRRVMTKGGEFSDEPKPLMVLRWIWCILPVLRISPASGKRHPAENPQRRWVILQLGASLVVLFFLARAFVHEIEWLSDAMSAPAIIISLLIIPIATELPEKLNSIIWVRGNHDTLAMGNVSGAMVFQSSIPVTIGLWFTEWSFTPLSYAFAACVLTVVSGLLVWSDLRRTGEIHHRTLLLGGFFYIAFILLVVFRAFPG